MALYVGGTAIGATATEINNALDGMAQGDIVYASAADTPAQLTKGTDDYVLTMNGNVPNWEAAAGGGDVSKVGTPVDNEVGVWTGDGTLEGDPELTFDTSTAQLSVGNSTATAANLTVYVGSWDEPRIRLYPEGNYQFHFANVGTSGSKRFELQNNNIDPIMASGGNNSTDMWFAGNVSAASFTTRTPYPETLQIAYDVLASHKKLDDYDVDDKQHQLDHSKLHDFAKPQITVSSGTPDNEVITTELGQDGCDASAVISCLVEVVNDLTAKVEALENA